MADTSYLTWPFFEDSHREFARHIDDWAAKNIGTEAHEYADVNAESRRLARAFGDAGLLAPMVPGTESAADVRMMCLGRAVVARYSALADVIYAMQGLGTLSITLFGSPEIRERFLPPARSGHSIAAFACPSREPARMLPL